MKIKPKTKAKVEKPVQKHVWGRVTESKQRTVTMICTCGNKYIKTRKGQTECLWCLLSVR